MARVFVHINGKGRLLTGNGGFLMLSLFANKLSHIGYRVSVFNEDDTLTKDHWLWMDLREMAFDIVPFEEVLRETGPVVTSWLRAWLDVVESHFTLVPRLRYWCHDELLRIDSDRARIFVRDRIGPFAVTNPGLRPHYVALGLIPKYDWRVWVRDSFHPDDAERVPGRIGYQPDESGDDTLKVLRATFDHDDVLTCTGNQDEVASKMRTCDLFLSWNRPKNLLFQGEGFGLTLAEAVASGCAPVARAHAGNSWLRTSGKIPCLTQLDDALTELRNLREHPGASDQRRRDAEEAWRAWGTTSLDQIQAYLTEPRSSV